MNKIFIEKGKEYTNYNLSVIPTNKEKVAIGLWKKYQTTKPTDKELEELFSLGSPEYIAIICGKVSGNLEVVDVDTKHDTTGLLWNDLETLLKDNLPELYNSLVIATSVSGGKHIYYRCEIITSNKKLATNTNKEVLIETRGEGGYIIAYPSPGYSFIQSNVNQIPTITPEQREIVLSICRSFNEVQEVETIPTYKPTTTYRNSGVSPFEDYNLRGDVIGLMEQKGWTVTKRDSQRIYLKRPGDTKSRYSGNFHTGLKVLKVFSSSTEFDIDKGYNPSQVYSLLECNGDNSLAYKKLLQQGYGQPYNPNQAKTNLKTEFIKVEAIDYTEQTRLITTPGQDLKIEDIENTTGKQVVITSPEKGAEKEVIAAIELLQEAGKQVYIRVGDREVRDYKYQLQYVFNRYQDKEAETGSLTDKQVDSFTAEIVGIAARLQPIDKDIFVKFFTELEPIKKLGITPESLDKTVDKLNKITSQEEQTKELQTLLNDAKQLQEKGKTNEALQLLSQKVGQVKLRDKAEEFKKLTQPVTEQGIREKLQSREDYLKTGYTIEGIDLELPTGALTILAAPTSHGKTTFLINLAINTTKAYPDKEVYFFNYEEEATAIQVNALNCFIGKDISVNNTRTIKDYLIKNTTEFVKAEERDYFTLKTKEFFNDYLSKGRINISYIDYNVETLIDFIRYLHKTAKPGVIYIDYIQLLNLPNGKYKTYSRQEELKTICTLLKEVAVDTGLPIVLGAQFNRQVTNLLKIHPTEIGEAGDIERVANLVLGLWNLEHIELAKDTDTKELEKKKQGYETGLYTVVLKNRGGKIGQEEILNFNGNARKIENIGRRG
jgi:replicative DNA helicase